MGADLVVKVHYGAWLWQPLAKGKGVHREVKSEGSRRQNLAPRNTNRIRQVQLDEPAIYGEVLYNQELRVYMRRRHEMKVNVLTQGASDVLGRIFLEVCHSMSLLLLWMTAKNSGSARLPNTSADR